VRLNKYLADAGIASRRKCDELIARGLVSVDGRTVVELGTTIDPNRARVEVEGELISPEVLRPRYYLLNKPRGVVCTNDAHEARLRAVDLITDRNKGRIYTVGRLDEESTGLILLTSDGEFANRIAHPRYGVHKTYEVRVKGRIPLDAIESVRKGVYLSEGKTERAHVRIRKRTHSYSTLSVTLAEGKNREVRRIFAKLGHDVLTLRRSSIGNLRDSKLPEGAWRPLRKSEVDDLLSLSDQARAVAFAQPRRLPDAKRWRHQEPKRGQTGFARRGSTGGRRAQRPAGRRRKDR
jgi:23S rRNA pseudouridine2605 synthase